MKEFRAEARPGKNRIEQSNVEEPMKKNVSPIRFLAAACLAIALGTPVHSFAQVAPRLPALPNVDKRLQGRDGAALAADKKEALNSLRAGIPGLKTQIDPLLNAPVYFSASKGFLSGPNGSGRGISADAAKNIPENDPQRAVKAFLNDHRQAIGYGDEVLVGAKIKRDFTTARSGLKTTVWQQQLDGIPVFESFLVGNLAKNGALVNLSTRFLPDVAKAANAAAKNPAISAAEAIANASKDVGSGLSPSELKKTDSPAGATQQQRFKAPPALKGEAVAELVWLPMSGTEVRLAWQVLFTDGIRSEMFQSIVDAQSGEVIVRRCLTEYISDATYNVYTGDSPSPFSPGHSIPNTAQPPLIPRTLVVTNAVSVTASPNGWINDGDTETLGNNVDAHLDADDDNVPDLPRPNGGAGRVFNFPLDLAQEPTTYGDAAVVQLFYWNNWFHDKLYELGFTEAAGNFQSDNFGRGGVGGDPVLADAQDGINLLDPFHDNNANMSTPPDGFSPRMQMYKFSGATPDRDGDLDAEVILHEHTHGLSNRRVGGGAGLFNLQSRGMGEGWSDFYALTLLSEPSDNINGCYPQGGYVTRDLFGLAENYYFGIRRYPYSTDMTKNPLTFKDIDPAQASSHPGIPVSPIFADTPADEPHAQGEVWCAILWEARAAMINKYGYTIGNQLILELVTDGMNLTPANPNFIQARDGILLADEVDNGGVNQNELWAAFAKRGLGVLASSPASTTTAGVIESYDVPGLALFSTVISGGNGNGIIDFNECNSLELTLTNIGFGASNISVTLTADTPEVIIAQGLSIYPDIPAGGTGVNLNPIRISTTPAFVCGTPIDLALVIKSDIDTRTNYFRLPSGSIGEPIRYDNSTPLIIPDGNPAGVSSPIVVSNFDGTIGKVAVALHLTHTFDFDLQLQLISPDGTIVMLSQNNGGSGDDFGSDCSPDTLRTRFDDEASVSISAGIPPFVGSFQPDQPLSNFNLKSGTNVNGIWQLKVVDQNPFNTGAIQCWSLLLSPQVCTDGGGECPGSDLAVSMVASPDPALTGSNLTYTITVTNYGPSTAKAVILSQTLPTGAIFVSATTSQGISQYSGGTVTCNFGSIGALRGATATIVVNPSVIGIASSTATVGSGQLDPDPSNNSVTVLRRVVPPSADLTVTVSDSPDPIYVGGNLTYNISVTNRGPTTANAVVLTNVLPATASFVSASSTQGSFINAGGTIIYNLGTIEGGANALVTIVVQPILVGSISETSTVGSEQADLFPANNVASAITTVSPAADLALSIIDSPDPVVTGSNVTYVITVTNRGPNAASGVVVNGSMPPAATLVTNTISQGTFVQNGNNFIANLNSLDSGNSATITIVMAAPTTAQTITLSASVLSSQADPNSQNNSASAQTVVAQPFVSIVPAGSILTAESFTPANGSVDSGETVSVVLRLRNAGNVDTTNLVATLLSNGEVTSLSAPQNYGVLAAGGVSGANTFSFTAHGASGQTITATLQLQDGGSSLTNVNFTFTLPTVTTFSNTNLITIPDSGPASPYPSQITVSNLTGIVGNVAVTLDKINHTFSDDIDVLLVDPSGRKIILMGDAGGGNRLTDVSLTFDATASSAIADEDQLVSGDFVTANYSPDDFFTNAPAGDLESSLDVLDGTEPNGTWSLYVVDDTAGDEGNIAGGWSLTITTLAPVNQIAGLSIAVTNSTSAVLVNGNASYTFAITNNGPDVANDVIVNNPLPADCTAITPTTFSLGKLEVGASTNVTVTLIPGAVGMLTNSATVSASEIDLNALNNSASAVTAVGLPVAELGIAASGSGDPIVGLDFTYTISVTNSGPDSALDVVVTNRLPAGMSFVSATASQGTCLNSAGVVTCSLGNVGVNNSVTISIVAKPLAAGVVTNKVNVVTASNDPNAGNNSANVISTVANPSPNVVASGSSLISESALPNGVIDPGESVQIAFALANIGTADTANLVATLQASGGVTSSSSQTYGVLIHDGAAVSKTFAFTVATTNNGTITATLKLQDGAKNLGNVTFTFDSPKFGGYANSSSISIPNSGPATPYPSIITVSNATGLVSKVSVKLIGLNHSFPDDLDILLVSPSGEKVLLMSDVGGAHSVSGVNLTFNDSGAALLDAAQIVSGTNSPTDLEPGESLPSAPARPYSSSLTAFNGGNPNGDWKLYINDDNGGDSGALSGGWSLDLTTVNTINPSANLAVSIDAPASAGSGDTMNYTITVSNQGPATANSVTLTDTLPANFTFDSALPSQGSYLVGGGVVTCNLGSINSGAIATVVLTGVPTAIGTITNSASATANETDLYLVNNAAQATTSVENIAPSTLGLATVMPDGSFQLTLTGQSDSTYRIDASSDLINWIPVKTNVAGVDGKFQFTDSAATNFNPRFYRAVRLQ